jgi:hypothetical protein
MHCPNHIALSALRRGHVRWDQLHPRVRLRLSRQGYAANRLGAPPSAWRGLTTVDFDLEH